MECKDCGGKIDFSKRVSLRTSCRACSWAYPCEKCGRLHFLQGDEVHKTTTPVSNRSGDGAYVIEGKFVLKPV